MNYQFNEGRIAAPPKTLDRTVNLLVPTPGAGGLTIAITRDDMQADETPQQFLDRQMADLGRQVSKYKKSDQEAVHLGPSSQKVIGVKFQVSYKQHGKTVHHLQAMFLLPGSRTVLSFTFSLAVAFAAEHLQQAADVLASFELRQ